MSIDPIDILAYLVIAVAILMTLGVGWMWTLYFGPDNPHPRSRLLRVLCLTGSLITFAEWPLAFLAYWRLSDGPTLGTAGGLVLTGAILVLAGAFLVIIGYLFRLRRTRLRQNGRSSPPPFREGD